MRTVDTSKAIDDAAARSQKKTPKSVPISYTQPAEAPTNTSIACKKPVDVNSPAMARSLSPHCRRVASQSVSEALAHREYVNSRLNQNLSQKESTGRMKTRSIRMPQNR